MNQREAIFKRGRFWPFRFRVDGKRIHLSTHETVNAKPFLVAQQAHEPAKCRARAEDPEPTIHALETLWSDAIRRPGGECQAGLPEMSGRVLRAPNRTAQITGLVGGKVAENLAQNRTNPSREIYCR